MDFKPEHSNDKKLKKIPTKNKVSKYGSLKVVNKTKTKPLYLKELTEQCNEKYKGMPILTTSEYLSLSTPTNTNTCKGKYYRCQNKKFNSKGTICQSIKFVPLKRKSCDGCDQCNSLIDSLPEIDYNYLCNNPKDGAIYKLSITNIMVGFGEDYADDWDLEFVLVEE